MVNKMRTKRNKNENGYKLLTKQKKMERKRIVNKAEGHFQVFPPKMEYSLLRVSNWKWLISQVEFHHFESEIKHLSSWKWNHVRALALTQQANRPTIVQHKGGNINFVLTPTISDMELSQRYFSVVEYLSSLPVLLYMHIACMCVCVCVCGRVVTGWGRTLSPMRNQLRFLNQ